MRDEVTSLAWALLRWSPGYATSQAARRSRAFAEIGDEERAQTWREIEQRIRELALAPQAGSTASRESAHRPDAESALL